MGCHWGGACTTDGVTSVGEATAGVPVVGASVGCHWVWLRREGI